MQRHLSPPFKMKYPELAKGVTSTDFMWFSTSSVEPAPTRPHASMETHREPSNIGFTGFSAVALLDCAKGTGRGAQIGFLPRTRKDCEMRYGVLLGNWGMTRTCGMVCCSLTISKSITLSPSVCDNVKGYFTSWDLPCRGLAARLVKPLLSGRRPLKKLLPVDE